MTAPIAIQCNDCGVRMRVPAAKAGQRGKCPRCGNRIKVPASNARQRTSSAVSTPAPAARIRFACHTCGKLLKAPADAAGRRVRCPDCHSTVIIPQRVACDPSPALPPVPEPTPFNLADRETARRHVSANSALLCVLGSALAAAIGAGIWVCVSRFTAVEHASIACGIGALAGLGAILGARSGGSFPGFVAMGTAALGILSGKLAVFYLTLLPPSTAAADVPVVSRDQLANLVAQSAVEAEGVRMDQEEAWDRAMARQIPLAATQIAAMSDQQVQQKTRDLVGRLRGDANHELLPALSETVLRPLDRMFLGLALLAALVIGSGGFAAPRASGDPHLHAAQCAP